MSNLVEELFGGDSPNLQADKTIKPFNADDAIDYIFNDWMHNKLYDLIRVTKLFSNYVISYGKDFSSGEDSTITL